MDAKELFKQVILQATTVVNTVKPTDFDKPTPDTEWDVRTLAGHMLYELSWTADIARGATIAEVGTAYDGDLIGEDLAVSWCAAAEAALHALEEADMEATAHLSYGDVPMENYLKEAASDQLIHSWDLGSAIGIPVRFGPDVAEEIYNNALPRREEMRRSGLFGEPKEVQDDADIQTKLLALYGRSSNWPAGQQATAPEPRAR